MTHVIAINELFPSVAKHSESALQGDGLVWLFCMGMAIAVNYREDFAKHGVDIPGGNCRLSMDCLPNHGVGMVPGGNLS